jgi:hypothetical protein
MMPNLKQKRTAGPPVEEPKPQAFLLAVVISQLSKK